MPSYKAVSTSIPSYTVPFGYKLGNALSALGGAASQIGQDVLTGRKRQEEEEAKKRLKDANEAVARIYSSLSQNSGSDEGQATPANTATFEGKIPNAMRFEASKPADMPTLSPGTETDNTMPAPVATPTNSLAGANMGGAANPLMATRGEGSLLGAMPQTPTEQPASNLSPPGMPDIKSMQMMGMQKLAQSVPKDVLGRQMAAAQAASAEYFKAGRPDLAMKLIDHQLDMMKNVYGADVSILKAVLSYMGGRERNQATAAEGDLNRKNRLMIAGLHAQAKRAATGADVSSKDLASLTQQYNAGLRALTQLKQNYADQSDIDQAESQLTEISDQLQEMRRRRTGVLEPPPGVKIRPTAQPKGSAGTVRMKKKGETTVKLIPADKVEEAKKHDYEVVNE